MFTPHFAIGFGERFDLKGIKAGLYPWSAARHQDDGRE